MIKTQPIPIQVVKAAWIGVNSKPKIQKGQWHKWIKEIYIFFKLK